MKKKEKEFILAEYDENMAEARAMLDAGTAEE